MKSLARGIVCIFVLLCVAVDIVILIMKPLLAVALLAAGVVCVSFWYGFLRDD